MAETAGLAIGIIGLAGLFTTCAGCYQLVRRGAMLDRDYKILETKFNNQELRLLSWGKACGLSGIGMESYDKRLDDPILRSRITATLECIKQLFHDEAALTQRYGLGSSKQRGGNRASALQLLGSSSLGARRPFFFWKKQQRANRLWDAASWAVSDRERFSQLITHLKDFNDDLEAMTRCFGDIALKQRHIVEVEISEVEDLETLEEIALASQDDEGLISDTVSLRLNSIRSGSIREGHEIGNSLAFDSTFKTAPATVDETLAFNQNPAFQTISPLISEPLPRTRFKCVVVGDRNAGKTRLLSAFAYDRLPAPYSPTVFDSCIIGCRIDAVDLQLELKDTSGQEDYDKLRPFSYKGADVVLLCFRAENPTAETKEAILGKWTQEIKSYCPEIPIILVGLKNPDEEGLSHRLQDAPQSDQFVPLCITKDIGATRYFFCDPETGFGVHELLQFTLRIAVQYSQPPPVTPTRVKRRSRVSEIVKDFIGQQNDG
ncbi:prion-inhibition and propagation-domain-containing protein [Cercophora samala]|uniref:Prion-inhibition and propagation-domain-containing protein n=1 Tax=Cercophora samala TaxID=330535 RepID=A0AA40DDR7_9PEZI|nr:prion-inhibition and propagation-domain-containing protein [Cercophora samala]